MKMAGCVRYNGVYSNKVAKQYLVVRKSECMASKLGPARGSQERCKRFDATQASYCQGIYSCWRKILKKAKSTTNIPCKIGWARNQALDISRLRNMGGFKHQLNTPKCGESIFRAALPLSSLAQPRGRYQSMGFFCVRPSRIWQLLNRINLRSRW
jgi:hypothetical protein